MDEVTIQIYTANPKLAAILLGPLGAMLPSCGPEAVVHADLEEVCGAPSPVRVLELEPDQVVRASETIRVQDRAVYVVSRLDADDPDVPYSVTAESEVWSAGPCGESPVQLAAGIDDIFTVDVWPDLVLGCDKATGDVVVLDPTGAAEPHVAFPAVPLEWSGCGLAWTDFGVLSVRKHDEELGALMLHPYPPDPHAEASTPIVLIDPIRLAPSSGGGPGSIGNLLYTFPDHALALTPDDALVRVELSDGSVSTLQAEVTGFTVSRDGRHRLWQDAAVTAEDPRFPEGELVLQDEVAGSHVVLGEAALSHSKHALQWVDRGLVQIGLGTFTDPKRIFSLPELNHTDVAGDLLLNAPLADGRWVVQSIFTDGFVDALELPSGQRTRLFPREAEFVGLDDDAVRVLEVPRCCLDSDHRAEGPLWRVPIDGSAATRLADRATRYTATLDDGRLVGPLGAGAHWLASLVIVEPETRAESRVDERVHFFSIDTTQTDDEGIVRYSVSDGDRSGVYLARLPSVTRSRTGASTHADGEAVVFDLMQGRDGQWAPEPREPGKPFPAGPDGARAR